MIPKVQNMTSTRSYRPVANQFIIRIGNTEYFQSYSSIIARNKGGKITLDKNTWNYSRTTAKYRREFLGENTEDTRKKIKSGEYKLANLNR